MSESSLRPYLTALRRQLWLIVFTVALSVGAALVISVSQKPTYRASTKIFLGQGEGLFPPEVGNVAQPFTQTMTTLLESDIVASTVIRNLGLEATPEELLNDLRVSSRPDSAVLEVTFDSADRAQGVRILAEITKVFPERVKQRIGGADGTSGGTSAITASVWDPAHTEPGQISPRPMQTSAFAGVLGVALGLMLGFLRENLDDRLRTRRQAEEWFGAEVVAAVPKGLVGCPPFGLAGQAPPKKKEHVRSTELLRASIQLSDAANARSILVTSAGAREGKSTVTAQLSVALAMAGNDVICVEADIHRPTLHRYLGLPANGNGVANKTERFDLDHALTDVSLIDGAGASAAPIASSLTSQLRRYHVSGREEADPPQAVQAVEPLTAQPPPLRQAPGQLRTLLSSHLTAEMLKADPVTKLATDLLDRARYVVFDAPPVPAMGDAYDLLGLVDRVIVVARLSWTRKDAAEVARDLLQRLGIRNLSIVLVDWELHGREPY